MTASGTKDDEHSPIKKDPIVKATIGSFFVIIGWLCPNLMIEFKSKTLQKMRSCGKFI
ncbi:hypothetical protein GI584_19750 [Gracilibacillus salitolerans]|uniref:Uncharacterized protein n=1 Tax=Gracilibacillus salitolerans TaxID=2663022 RepID=A0A5Q2TQ31_9BACI|nr:hypothetical protein [Gracilibacillus salitolerans]QGH36143.1 hypothetical protein GI584_19750 [Gracilibacillus salitolerans]